MAAGDRNKNGRPKDIVRHYGMEKRDDIDYLKAYCGNKRAGYVTDDISDVTCINCNSKLLLAAVDLNNKAKGLFIKPNN